MTVNRVRMNLLRELNSWSAVAMCASANLILWARPSISTGHHQTTLRGRFRCIRQPVTASVARLNRSSNAFSGSAREGLMRRGGPRDSAACVGGFCGEWSRQVRSGTIARDERGSRLVAHGLFGLGVPELVRLSPKYRPHRCAIDVSAKTRVRSQSHIMSALTTCLCLCMYRPYCGY